MKRLVQTLLPSPGLSLGLFCGWLLLNRSLSIGQLLLGALVAVVMPLLAERKRQHGHSKRWHPRRARRQRAARKDRG